MKLSLYCFASLILAVAAAAGIGYAPTLSRWGAEGVSSMAACATICLASALIAMLPMIYVAPRWPDQIGSAALAATVIRLMLTMAAMVGYEILARPQMESFLTWAVVFYLLVLAIDTTFGVIAIQRHYRVAPPKNESSAT